VSSAWRSSAAASSRLAIISLSAANRSGKAAFRQCLKEAVAAEEEPIAGAQPAVELVKLERLGADGAGDDIGGRMMFGFRGADRAGIEQLLHQAVVARQLAKPPVA